MRWTPRRPLQTGLGPLQVFGILQQASQTATCHSQRSEVGGAPLPWRRGPAPERPAPRRRLVALCSLTSPPGRRFLPGAERRQPPAAASSRAAAPRSACRALRPPRRQLPGGRPVRGCGGARGCCCASRCSGCWASPTTCTRGAAPRWPRAQAAPAGR